MTGIKDKPKCSGFLAQAMKAYWLSISTAPLITNLGSRCKRVVLFTPQPPYPRRKNPVTVEQEAGWATEQDWDCRRR